MATRAKFTIKEYEIMLLLTSDWALFTNREGGDTYAYMMSRSGARRTVHFPAVKGLIRKGYISGFQNDMSIHIYTFEGFAALDDFIESRKGQS